MANPRALDKRRKSIRNVRKITRTMELIATARFKKAMDRAHAATAYTNRVTQLVADLANTGAEAQHPLLEPREETKAATLLVITANRGWCGGYNSNLVRVGMERWKQLTAEVPGAELEVSGKRGISAFRFRDVAIAQSFTHFNDRPLFAEVELIANRFLEAYVTGTLDRLDVAYMKFENIARQTPAVETLLPLGALGGEAAQPAADAQASRQYEFLPSAASILEEVVPMSFKVKLFKCFLDAAVSEQIARMVAMKSATENADEMIRHLSRTYNRARQSRITSELLELMGGAEALNK
jgi:F-type H+-transporting ATPase subunit gamma